MRIRTWSLRPALTSSLVSLMMAAIMMVGVACPADPPPAPPPTRPAQSPPVPPPPTAARSRVVAEPSGLIAGSATVPATPQGKDAWVVDTAQTQVSFYIMAGPAGRVTGRFPGGASGAFDMKNGRGVFHIDLLKIETTNAAFEKNPTRDANVLEAFFSARPVSAEATRAAVDTAWEALRGKLKRGVPRATLIIGEVEGPIANPPEGELVRGAVYGQLVLWDSVKVPVSFTVAAERKGDIVQVASASPAVIDLEQLLGTALRDALFGTMLAAGCTHKDIDNKVAILVDRVVLKRPGAK